METANSQRVCWKIRAISFVLLAVWHKPVCGSSGFLIRLYSRRKLGSNTFLDANEL
jgi:hypothetical protein